MSEQPLPAIADLPQRFDVWQADARPMALPMPGGAAAAHPWLVAVVSRTDGQVLAFELSQVPPGAGELLAALRKAMQAPETSEPHRPTELQVARAEWAEELRGPLEVLGVACTAVDYLDEIDTVFAELGGALTSAGEPGLLDMPEMTPEAVGPFFDAAAHFYEAAPWKKAGERPIEIACARYEGGPRYAVVIGQAGLSVGLILYDSLATLLQILEEDHSEEESAGLTSALVVNFGTVDELPPADQAAIQTHGWRVAGENAYPTVYRLEAGLNMRPPLAWELELLEGALRAVPEFLRKKTRRRTPLTLSVPTSGGGAEMTLAWVG